MADNIKTISDLLVTRGKELASEFGAIKAATEALDGANAAQTGKRRVIMLALAEASVAGKFDEKDITAGVAAAVKAFASNAMSEKTFQNFASEAKKAMHPRVRAGYAALCSIADKMFSQVKEENATTIDAYKRSQLMVNSIASAVAKDEKAAMPTDDAGVRKFSAKKLKDTNESASRIRAQLKKARESVGEAFKTFKHPDLEAIMDLCEALCEPKVLEDALAANTTGKNLRKKSAKAKPDASDDGASDIETTLAEMNA